MVGALQVSGGQTVWKISLDKLSRKIGTTRDLRRFKHDLFKIIALDRIPDYRLSVETLAGGLRPIVVVEPRPRCSESAPEEGIGDAKRSPRRRATGGKRAVSEPDGPAPVDKA